MPLIVSVRVPALWSDTEAGSASRTSAKEFTPSSIRRSIRLSFPDTRRISWAPEMSIKSTSERPDRVSSSVGLMRSTTGRSHDSPSTRTESVSPSATPAVLAKRSPRMTPVLVVSIRETSNPDAPPATYGRNGPSRKGSTPSILIARPGMDGDEPNPSTTGATAARS